MSANWIVEKDFVVPSSWCFLISLFRINTAKALFPDPTSSSLLWFPRHVWQEIHLPGIYVHRVVQGQAVFSRHVEHLKVQSIEFGVGKISSRCFGPNFRDKKSIESASLMCSKMPRNDSSHEDLWVGHENSSNSDPDFDLLEVRVPGESLWCGIFFCKGLEIRLLLGYPSFMRCIMDFLISVVSHQIHYYGNDDVSSSSVHFSTKYTFWFLNPILYIPKIMVPPNHPGLSIKNHPFWVFSPYFWKRPYNRFVATTRLHSLHSRRSAGLREKNREAHRVDGWRHQGTRIFLPNEKSDEKLTSTFKFLLGGNFMFFQVIDSCPWICYVVVESQIFCLGCHFLQKCKNIIRVIDLAPFFQGSLEVKKT